MFQDFLLQDDKVINKIEGALRETYFSFYDQEFLTTADGREDIDNNVYKRYNHALVHVLPWVNRYKELAGARLLEIGSGTGSSAAAFAHVVESVKGYDIHEPSVLGARRRLEIMGLTNVDLHVVSPESLLQQVVEDSDGAYEIILLYAVLEHQTVAERNATLETCWQLLADEGVLAVVDTPNLLTYFDEHTSRMPFLHLLPSELYARYAFRSERSAFRDAFQDLGHQPGGELEEGIARWGRGVSFHDFELALGEDYKQYIVSHGFDEEILTWFPVTVEEQLLRWYINHHAMDIPVGFSRWVLNLMLKKSVRPHATDSSVPVPEDDFSCNVSEIRRQLVERDQLIKDIYSSRTWRTGNLLAAPYRKVHGLFTGLFK